MNKLGQEIIKEITVEEYEIIIFNYLLNNCVDLKDENIKEIVNLKCKQFESIYRENQQLKEKQHEFIDYLEKESKEVIRDAGYHKSICLDILENYKEIIGSGK